MALTSVTRVVVLALGCSLVRVQMENFHAERTLIIDWSGRNYLFRGNMPINGSQFVYTELISTLRKVALHQKNLTLPEKFYLTDISYLNPFEFTDEDVELQFFKGNPSLGKYYNWIIVGDVVDPDWFSEAIRKEMAVYLNDWQLDHLPERVDLLRKLLHSNLSLPNVIYTHCEAGTDRTGEVSGAYYMRYLNMTFEQALSIDNHVQNRSIAKMSLRGLKWYCYYLQYDKDYNVNCTVPSYILSAGFNSIKT